MAAANQNPSVPWDQTPEYVALTDHVIPPGGQTSYTHPHPTGTSPTDLTAFVYGQRDIHLDNWPNVLYMLFPTPEWEAFKRSGPAFQKLNANGQPMFERWPRAGQQARRLLDYPILPDSISSRESLWWFDIWRKMDPRMSWDDLTMRIEVQGRTKDTDKRLQNSIQTMLGRYWHVHYHMISWLGKGRFHYNNVADPARVRLLNDIANAGIPLHLNTTRGLTPGVVDPSNPNSARIPRPNIPGGTVTGPRTTTAITAVANAAVVPATAAVAPPQATNNAVTGDTTESEEWNLVSEEEDDENTDAFNESDANLNEGEDSLALTPTVSNEPEPDENPAANSDSGHNADWEDTDESDEDAPVYSHLPTDIAHVKRSATAMTAASSSHERTAPVSHQSSARSHLGSNFTPINHPARDPTNAEGNSPVPSRQVKRRRTGREVHPDTTILASTAAENAADTISAEHIPPPFSQSASPNIDPRPSQTPGLANQSEPHQVSADFPEANTEVKNGAIEARGVVNEDMDLGLIPDGSFY